MYLARIRDIKKSLDICNTLDYAVTEKNIVELDKISRELMSLVAIADNVKNMCLNKQTKQYNVCRKISPCAVIIKQNMMCVAPGVKIPAINVKSVNDIPDTPMYYVNNKFAFRVGNVLFSGNIGNIYNKTDAIQGLAKKTVICRDNCKNKMCKFYHDGDLRNFSSSSWIYTNDIRKSSNANMRHIGSRDTFASECIFLQLSDCKKTQVENYRHQTMHDILVVLGMSAENLMRD